MGSRGSGEPREQDAHERDGGGTDGRGDDGRHEQGGVDLLELHVAHGQQHEDAARIGHGVERGGRKRGHAVDGAGRQAERLQLRRDDRQRDELAGGRAAGEHAHERHNDPADEDRRDADACDGGDHGLERVRVGDDAGEAADRGDGHRHGHGVDGAAVEHCLEILAAQLRPEQHEGQRDGAQQADVDVELPDVEQQEKDGHRNEGDDQLRLAALRTSCNG